MVDRVIATEAARILLRDIIAEHGPVLFHQSGGCCDGSAPMCYTLGDFYIGPHDVLLGNIDGTDIYVSGPQFVVWKQSQLILDAGEGSGAAFSLDNGRTQRFISEARIFTPEEIRQL